MTSNNNDNNNSTTTIMTSILAATETATLSAAVATLGIAIALGWLLLKRQQISKDENPSADDAKDKGAKKVSTTTATPNTTSNNISNKATTTTTTTGVVIPSNLPPVDVWAERRQRGIAAHSLHHRPAGDKTKKIASSYYYAHNDSSTTGGYKDGLKMEDFAMNGPRLLSKGGKPVVDDPKATMNDDTHDEAAVPVQETAPTPIATLQQHQQHRRRIPITQYLWDDEGGKTATIIIDKIPGGRSTDPTMAWSAASVDRVEATLTADHRGLQVVVFTPLLDWDYQLHVQPLFATATTVEALNKPKRCRIKIVKQSVSAIFSKYEKWPHAHKKKT